MIIKLARPCIEDPARYVAEAALGRCLHIEKACFILRSLGFSGLKCSTSLGVARFELDGRAIMIYQSGRIDIRRVRDIKEASMIVEQVREIISSAFYDS